jgi:hypothetical protein
MEPRLEATQEHTNNNDCIVSPGQCQPHELDRQRAGRVQRHKSICAGLQSLIALAVPFHTTVVRPFVVLFLIAVAARVVVVVVVVFRYCAALRAPTFLTRIKLTLVTHFTSTYPRLDTLQVNATTTTQITQPLSQPECANEPSLPVPACCFFSLRL